MATAPRWRSSSSSRARRLRALLAAHAGADDLEAAHLRAMLDVLDSTPDPLSRHQFDPGHFTASAFVLSADDAEVLLVHHATLADWMQPGGHIEPDDTGAAAAAQREVVEETSLASFALASDAVFDVDVHPIPAGRDPAHLHFDVRFLFRASSREVVAGPGVTDVAWAPLAGLGTEGTLGDASVRRALAKLRP